MAAVVADADDRAISAHYASGNLRDRIAAGLAQLDEQASIDLLAPADEFHLGGRPATAHLVDQMGLESTDAILDIGSGIGGLARFIAATIGAHVTGVDLTEEYVDVAEWLTALVGLSDRASFRWGTATALEFDDSAFDAATMVHVGMNVADKATLFCDVARVLRQGGTFAIYDIVATGDLAAEPVESLQHRLAYPLPWASGPATSRVESLAAYVSALEGAGFEAIVTHDRTDAITAFLAQVAASPASAGGGPPPLGIHLVMGSEAPRKIANLVSALRAGLLAPTEIIARSGGH